MYLTYNGLELGRVGKIDKEWEGKNTKRCWPWALNKWHIWLIRGVVSHVFQVGSVLCVTCGRQDHCWVAADATVSIQGWLPVVELWDGQSLVSGQLAGGLLVWFIWVFAHWASLTLSYDLTPGLWETDVLTFAYAGFPIQKFLTGFCSKLIARIARLSDLPKGSREQNLMRR